MSASSKTAVADMRASSGVADGYDRNAAIHTVFAAHAQANPEAVAVVADDDVVTYGALAARSRRIAAFLRARGVGHGDVVGLLGYRSADAVAAMLGVFQIGACYAPLDPSYPASRLATMAEDAKPKIILADARLIPQHKELSAHTAAVAGIDEARATPEDGVPEAVVAATDLAYVLFTSGSTGRPKAVRMPHRGVVRLVRGQDYLHFGPDEAFLHVAPLTFDVSTIEIWGALLNGGRLVIIPDPHYSVDRFTNAIRDHGVTSVAICGGFFNLMVDQRLDGLGRLKQMTVGGEVLSPAHVNKALAAYPHLRIVNAYGPTENAGITTAYVVTANGWGDGSIPIGKPIAHCEAYIVDDALGQVPDGEVGQIACAGDGVAAGYLNRPDLTAERFKPDPFSAAPGATMYLSGDLGRRRADGEIEFLGRNDRQLKIDGRRVELDEIEASLREDDRLADAAIDYRAAGDAAKRIVAYLKPRAPVCAGEADAFAADVIARLKERLPGHMIPSAAAVIEVFPLTPTGKVDLRQLPDPKVNEAESRDIVAPTTDLEGKIAGLWREVLGVDAVGVDDNFFDLGGTSQQLVRIHAELKERHGVELPITALFEHPKIRDLAARIAQGEDQQGGATAGARDRARRQADALRRMRQRAKPGA